VRYRSDVRRAALVIAILGAPATAGAGDPDALFGFDEPPPPETSDAPDPCDALPIVWACASLAGDEPEPAPAVIREHLTRTQLWDLGAADGSWITGARRALGASTDPFAPAPAFAGASALENRWTLDGLPVDAVTDGAPELRVPLAFLTSIDVLSGGLPASARASTGAVIDGQLRGGGADDEGLEAHLWLGAGAPARAAREPVDTFDPLILDADPLRSLTATVTAGGHSQRLRFLDAWYFVGFGVEADGDGSTRLARRLADADGDGRYDRDDDQALIKDTIEARDVGGSAFAVPYLARFGGARGPHRAAVTVIGSAASDARRAADGTVAATTIDRTSSVIDLMATWDARWGATELHLAAGWHHARRDEAGADGVQIGTAYLPDPGDVPDDATLASACVEESGTLDLCPLSTGYYVRGGAGLLTDTTSDRPTASAEVAHRVHAHGLHRVAIGATLEDARLRVHRRFSGGSIERRLSEDIILTTRYDGESDTRTYRTRSLAAYVEDAWRPIAGLTVQGGVRWESMEVGTALRFRDQVAPRFAISADPTERGRSRLYVSWGRYFPLLPASLGPAVIGEADLLTTIESGLGSTETVRSGDPLPIADELEPPMVEEAVAGAEWVIAERLHVGATYRARWLRRGLEDVTVGGALTFANPERQRRSSRDVLAWFGNAPDADLHVRVGYARTRLDGSWSGPHDPDEGTTLYRSSFDGETTSLGLLPLDTPHRLFIETIGHRAAGPWQLTIGARFQVASGVPVGAFGGAAGEVPLLPRGSLGRTPTTSSVLVHVGAVRGRLAIGLDVLDVFDRRAPAAVDQRWTTDDVRPIEGGDAADLLWLRTIDDDRARPNPGYGTASRYLPPVSARLSATFTY